MLPFAGDFYGSVTTNEKGQIVIPADARKALQINPGDKLLVMGGPDRKGLFVVKPELLVEMAKKFEANKTRINEMIDKDKK